MDIPEEPQQDSPTSIDPVFAKLLEDGASAQLEWVSKMRFRNPTMVAQFGSLLPHDLESFSQFIDFIYQPPLDVCNTLIRLDFVAIQYLEACGAPPDLIDFLEQFGTIPRYKTELLDDITGHIEVSPAIALARQTPIFFLTHLADYLFDQFQDKTSLGNKSLSPRRVRILMIPGLPPEKKIKLMTMIMGFHNQFNWIDESDIRYLTDGLPQDLMDEFTLMIFNVNLGKKYLHLVQPSDEAKKTILDCVLMELPQISWKVVVTKDFPTVLQKLNFTVPKSIIMQIISSLDSNNREPEPYRITRLADLIQVTDPEAFPEIADFLIRSLDEPHFYGTIIDMNNLWFIFTQAQKTQFCETWLEGYLKIPSLIERRRKRRFLLEYMNEFPEEKTLLFLEFDDISDLMKQVFIDIHTGKHQLTDNQYARLWSQLPSKYEGDGELSNTPANWIDSIIKFCRTPQAAKQLYPKLREWEAQITGGRLGELYFCLVHNGNGYFDDFFQDIGILKQIIQSDSKAYEKACERSYNESLTTGYDLVIATRYQDAMEELNFRKPVTLVSLTDEVLSKIRSFPKKHLDPETIQQLVEDLKRNPFRGILPKLIEAAHQLTESQIHLCIHCGFLQQEPENWLLPLFPFMTLKQIKHMTRTFFEYHLQDPSELLWIVYLPIPIELVEEFNHHILDSVIKLIPSILMELPPSKNSSFIGFVTIIRTILVKYPQTAVRFCTKISEMETHWLGTAIGFEYFSKLFLLAVSIVPPEEKVIVASLLLLETCHRFSYESVVPLFKRLGIEFPVDIQKKVVLERLANLESECNIKSRWRRTFKRQLKSFHAVSGVECVIPILTNQVRIQPLFYRDQAHSAGTPTDLSPSSPHLLF